MQMYDEKNLQLTSEKESLNLPFFLIWNGLFIYILNGVIFQDYNPW